MEEILLLLKIYWSKLHSKIIIIMIIIIFIQWGCLTSNRSKLVHRGVFLLFFLFVFVLCFVYPVLPVSLKCQFYIFPSVITNVYFIEANDIFSFQEMMCVFLYSSIKTFFSTIFVYEIYLWNDWCSSVLLWKCTMQILIILMG